MPVAKAQDADVQVARRHIVETALDEGVLTRAITVLDDALVRERLLDGPALVGQVVQRGREIDSERHGTKAEDFGFRPVRVSSLGFALSTLD